MVQWKFFEVFDNAQVGKEMLDQIFVLRKLVTDTCNEITRRAHVVRCSAARLPLDLEQPASRKKTTAWWLDELEKASVGCSPIKNLKVGIRYI